MEAALSLSVRALSLLFPAIAPWGLTLAHFVADPAPRPAHRPALESPIERPVAANLGFRAPRLAPPACDSGQRGVASVTRRVTGRLAAARIPYSSDAFADCSAMAHRVLDSVEERCDGIARPSVEEARSAQAIASWYAAEGLLTTIHEPLDADDALVPGAIAFFGPPGWSAPTLDDVFHIGVVVSVHRDPVGRVESYRMFHGRRPGKVASITGWHRRDASPPLGNGSEVLVAVAWPGEELMPAGMGAIAEAPEIWATPSPPQTADR